MPWGRFAVFAWTRRFRSWSFKLGLQGAAAWAARGGGEASKQGEGRAAPVVQSTRQSTTPYPSFVAPLVPARRTTISSLWFAGCPAGKKKDLDLSALARTWQNRTKSDGEYSRFFNAVPPPRSVIFFLVYNNNNNDLFFFPRIIYYIAIKYYLYRWCNLRETIFTTTKIFYVLLYWSAYIYIYIYIYPVPAKGCNPLNK